jgi:hypothetical protein
MLKSVVCSTLFALTLASSAFGQAQFLKETESYKGVYLGYSKYHHNKTMSTGLLLAPSCQMGINFGFGRTGAEGAYTWVGNFGMDAWLIHEEKHQIPVSLCLSGAYVMTLRREPGFSDWALGFGASVHKNINFSDRYTLQPYAGLSFQDDELRDDGFMEVPHTGLLFAGRTPEDEIGFIGIGCSFFDAGTGYSIVLGFLWP